MNLFFGIDFSKEKFDVTVVYCENLNEVKPRLSMCYANDLKGFKSFDRWIHKNCKDVESLLFCGEKTGIYSSALSVYLFYAGYEMWLEDPYQIKHSIGLQRLKDDKADSGFIAEYAMRHQDKKMLYKPNDPSLEALRELFQFRNDLINEKKKLSMRMKEKSLANDGMKDIKKHFKVKDSVKDPYIFMESAVEKILKEYDKQLDACEKNINKCIESQNDIKENFEIVTSIKGVARVNAIALIVYTQNFSRFNYDSRKIACYYGIAPFGRSSGTSVKSNPHTSHMANKQLKALLTMAAISAVRYCPAITQFYNSRIARGKKPLVALNDTKNKILHIIVAMVKNKTKYNDHYLYDMKKQYEQRTA